jgi:hypothetical protein
VTQLPRRFHLQRDTDTTGMSGTGRVADGIRWRDGTASVIWLSPRPSIAFWYRIGAGMTDAEWIHTHGGGPNTRIVWDDPEPEHTGGNAEDCPACAGTNPPYPFICPRPAAAPSADSQPSPLPEVWVVWREDEAAYGYFATEQAGKQATIDYWEEDEPACPDYSWRPDGPRWELLVGAERSGVYASRHKVYSQPVATEMGA